ncbi:unnamed protein product [Rhizoctonia solani]|uniref:Uncharacterized protein n=1 Tax=Rhizoctonia solani TaxID=456999 RepID=A0A8H3CKP2_9AGAM|nr:unnamed protein product [Rhizoctonia solani]
MNSPTKAAIRTGSFQFDQNPFSATRSNSSNSYPDYAPPAYDVATAITTPGPETETKPEPVEIPANEMPDTRPSPTRMIDNQSIETVASHDPLDPLPLPLCFERTVTSDIPLEPLLQPFIVQARPGRKFLDDAFGIVDTSALERYDVLFEDWEQMLQDIQAVARLTKGQRATARVLPVTMYMGFTGFFVSRAIEKGMKRRNAAGVAGLLDIWNERFFRPRGLEIALCRGDWRVSGTFACDEVQLPAPDRLNIQPRQKGCCGSRKLDSPALEQIEGTLNGERKRTMCAERIPTQEQRKLCCSGNRESYRLVVVSTQT